MINSLLNEETFQLELIFLNLHDQLLRCLMLLIIRFIIRAGLGISCCSELFRFIKLFERFYEGLGRVVAIARRRFFAWAFRMFSYATALVSTFRPTAFLILIFTSFLPLFI